MKIITTSQKFSSSENLYNEGLFRASFCIEEISLRPCFEVRFFNTGKEIEDREIRVYDGIIFSVDADEYFKTARCAHEFMQMRPSPTWGEEMSHAWAAFVDWYKGLEG